MEAASMIPLNPRDYLVLLSLAAGERHGYGIVKEIERQSGGTVQVDPANLYRSLKRMMKQGLVSEAAAPPEAPADDARRRYYSITAFGDAVVRLEAARLAGLTMVARSRDLLQKPEAAG